MSRPTIASPLVDGGRVGIEEASGEVERSTTLVDAERATGLEVVKSIVFASTGRAHGKINGGPVKETSLLLGALGKRASITG